MIGRGNNGAARSRPRPFGKATQTGKDMKKKTAIELLEHFKGNFGSRPNLNQPFTQKGYYYATDAHTLVQIPIGKVKAKMPYEEQSEPKCGAVVPTQKGKVPFLVQDIVDAMASIKLKDELETLECDVCSGMGDGECPCCHQDVECEGCDGSGEVDGEPTGRKIPESPHVCFRIMESHYYFDVLRKLVDAAKILGEDTVYRLAGEHNRAGLFKVGEAQVICMPMLLDSGNESVIIKAQEETA